MKNLKRLLVGTILSFILIGGYTQAEGYWGYQLPPRQGNNYTQTHDKKTNDDYIKNTVNSLKNTDRVTFWACNAYNTQISADYYQSEGNTSNIKFDKSYAKKGTQIKMGMENYHWYKWERAFVSGDVDFR